MTVRAFGASKKPTSCAAARSRAGTPPRGEDSPESERLYLRLVQTEEMSNFVKQGDLHLQREFSLFRELGGEVVCEENNARWHRTGVVRFGVGEHALALARGPSPSESED